MDFVPKYFFHIVFFSQAPDPQRAREDSPEPEEVAEADQVAQLHQLLIKFVESCHNLDFVNKPGIFSFTLLSSQNPDPHGASLRGEDVVQADQVD